MFATRAYALWLVLSLATVVVVEVYPREHGNLSDAKVAARHRRFAGTLADMAARIGREDVEVGDEIRLAAVTKEVAALGAELRLRKIRTGAFVLLGVASALFAIVTLPGVLFRRRPAARAGIVEVEPDETVDIDPSDAVHEVGRLHRSQREAVKHLLDQISLHCSSCAWLWRPDVLGRVGRRILVRRMPPGASDPGDVLGEGFWARPSNPPRCPKCGSHDLVPD